MQGLDRTRQLCQGLVGHPKVGQLLGIDLRSMAAFRVGLAVVILVDLIDRSFSLTAHYTDLGLIPRSVRLGESTLAWLSLHMISGGRGLNGFLFVLAGVFALMLLVGYRTRFATVASWMMLVSLHRRNPILLNSGDTLLVLLLFWGMFLPLGACASVDARTARHKARPGRMRLTVGTVAILLQVVFMYVFTGLLKDNPIWHTQGTALYYAMNIDLMTTPLGRHLLNFPGTMRAMSIGTFYFEIFGPLLAFVPWWTGYLRTLAVLLFVGFHVGIAATMTVIVFPYVCMLAWVLFLPSGFWDGVDRSRCTAWLVRWWRAVVDRVAGGVAAIGRRGAWVLSPDADWRLSFFDSAVVTVVLVYVFVLNLGTYVDAYTVPWSVRRYGAVLRINQHWRMFAPYPMRDDGWYVIPAQLADGTSVDLVLGQGPVVWEKSRARFAAMGINRHRKHLHRLWRPAKHRPKVARYAAWLRKQWEQRHPAEQHVASMEVYFVCEYTLPDYQPPVVKRLLMYEWDRSGTSRVISYKENRRVLYGD